MFRSGLSLTVLLALSACTPQVPQVELELMPSVPTTTDDLTLSMTLGIDTAAEELDVAWFRDGTEVLGLALKQEAPASATARDEVWTVRVSTLDGELIAETDELVIANTAPTIEVAVDYAGPDAGQEVVASATALDADDDTLTLEWLWTVDGEDAGIDGPVIPAGRTVRGEVWQVSVTAGDGDLTSTPATASFTIGNSAPSIDAVAISPASPTVSDTIRCIATGWEDADGDAPAYIYEWQINDEPADGEDTLQASFAKGDDISCTVTPVDASTAGSPVSSSATVMNAAPQVTGLAFNSDAIVTTDTLTASPTATDADGDTIRFTYAWTIDGVVQSDVSDTASGFVFQQEVALTVTASDGEHSSQPWVSGVFTVGNSAPSIATATASPAQPHVGDALVCTIDGWQDADGHTEDVLVAWYSGEVVIGTGATLEGADFAAGDSLYCVATPFDGYDHGAPISSASVTAINSAPTVTSISINGSVALNGTDLTTTVGGAEDIDGDELDFIYSWTVDGQAAGTGDTFAVDGLSVGAEVQVSVVVSDGSEQSPSVTSSSVFVDNSAPVVDSVSLSSESATVSDSLDVLWTASDADGHDVEASIRWYVNDSEVDASGTRLDVGSYAVRGDIIRVEVFVADAHATSSAVSSGTVEVGNALPTAPEVSISPEAPTTDSSIACDIVSPSTDADGDALTYSIAWQIQPAEGEVIEWTPESEDDEYLGLAVLVGDTVSCIATVDDGVDTNASASASAVVEEAVGCSDSGCTVVTGDYSAWTLDGLALADGDLEMMSDTIGFDESGEFIVPDGVTELTVYVLGAGGGARGDFSYGGGGGGAAQRTFAVTPGQSIPFVVGVGGTGSTGWSSVQPVAGTDSSVTIGDVTLIGGGGGAGNGNTDEYSVGGLGGEASGGTVNVRGGHGGNSSLGAGDDGLEQDGVCSGGGGAGPLNGGQDHYWAGGLACYPAGPGGFGPPQYPTGSPGGDGVYGGGGGSGGNYGGLGGTGGSGYVMFKWHSASPAYGTGIGAAITKGAQSDTSTWDGMSGVQVSDNANGGEIFYAVSFDDHSSYAINIDGSWRSIVDAVDTNQGTVQSQRNNVSRSWRYNASNDAAGEEWVQCPENTPVSCVQVAFEVSANQMSGGRLSEISVEEWNADGGFVAGTLDFAVGIHAFGSGASPSIHGIQVIR